MSRFPVLLSFLVLASGSAADERRQIVDRQGRVIEVLEPSGRPRDLGQPADPASLHRDGSTARRAPVAPAPLRSLPVPGRTGRVAPPLDAPGTWPMFQVNARHTGFVPIGLNPATFAFRWQRAVGGGYALNPVSAGDGRVFVSIVVYFDNTPSLFALDAVDGHTLWSKAFGSIFSVNPPSYAYGNVYVQTGNHGSDTWLRAFDAATGAPVFQAPHTAQWERYFAPTVDDGKVYVNGGYYGGMYAFDAFSGAQLWFADDLPQYDQWTPAVAGTRAYAYLGEYLPGLYPRDRATGGSAGFVADANFDWDGWSMNLAPVVGDHDDVIAIHDGRLISFDTAHGTIRWELPAQFTGQPSLAQNRIYAVNGGRLVVLDELTHAEVWSWQAPDGAIVGPMVLTQTHLLASTAQSVHAVDLITHESVWTYPAGGHLALADDTLYIATAAGTLHAISAPRFIPAPLVGLEISGPADAVEYATTPYHALARYQDGSAVDRTLSTDWSVAPQRFAELRGKGLLLVRELLRPHEDVTLEASYAELGQSFQAAKTVRLVASIGPVELVQRNAASAMVQKQQALIDLADALEKERASVEIVQGLPQGPWSARALALLSRAICREEQARGGIEWSLYDLSRLLDGAPLPAPAPLPPPCDEVGTPE